MVLLNKASACAPSLPTVLAAGAMPAQFTSPISLPRASAAATTAWPLQTSVRANSTTAAAEIAAHEEGAAAVASVEAGIEHGLDIIARSIEDNPNNVTRFVIIGKEQPAPTGNDKTSIMFQVPHKPGALADVMVLFKNNGLNLTWIESFPVPGIANEYFFFVELEGHRDQPNVGIAIEKLRGEAIRLELLGSYPRS